MVSFTKLDACTAPTCEGAPATRVNPTRPRRDIAHARLWRSVNMDRCDRNRGATRCSVIAIACRLRSRTATASWSVATSSSRASATDSSAACTAARSRQYRRAEADPRAVHSVGADESKASCCFLHIATDCHAHAHANSNPRTLSFSVVAGSVVMPEGVWPRLITYLLGLFSPLAGGLGTSRVP